MRKFDPKRPHGLVCGSESRVRYEQDGVHFDAEGNEVGAKSEAAAAPTSEPGADVAPVDAQIAQQIGVDVDGDGKVDITIDVAHGKVKRKRK